MFHGSVLPGQSDFNVASLDIDVACSLSIPCISLSKKAGKTGGKTGSRTNNRIWLLPSRYCTSLAEALGAEQHGLRHERKDPHEITHRTHARCSHIGRERCRARREGGKSRTEGEHHCMAAVTARIHTTSIPGKPLVFIVCVMSRATSSPNRVCVWRLMCFPPRASPAPPDESCRSASSGGRSSPPAPRAACNRRLAPSGHFANCSEPCSS